MPKRKETILKMLEEAGVLTPAHIENAKQVIERSGPAAVARASQNYQARLEAFKRGEVTAVRLAQAHTELMRSIDQTGQEGKALATRAIALYQSVLGPKPKS